MKKMSRSLTHRAFWLSVCVQFVVAGQLWVAFQVAFAPRTSLGSQIWVSAGVFALVFTVFDFLSLALMRGPLKHDERLSDEQTASMDRAVHTGVLSLACLFADWGPALTKRRRDLVLALCQAPAWLAGVVALNAYDSFVDPEDGWFFCASSVTYALVATRSVVNVRREIRRVRDLESQLQELRRGFLAPA